MTSICDIKRFDPPSQKNILLKLIQGVIEEADTNDVNKLFSLVLNKLNIYSRSVLKMKAERAGYPTYDFLKCCIRWQLIWNHFSDGDEPIMEVLQDA